MTVGALRLFLGFPLTNFINEIEQVLAVLRPGLDGVKWVLPEQYHMTIHFFGDIPVSEVEIIDKGLRPLFDKIPPPSIRLTGIGAFPNMRRPNVLWLGVEEPRGTLQEIVLRVRQAVSQLGYPVEDGRAFTPHVTLGRIKNISRQDKIETMLTGRPLPLPTSLKPLKKMVLFKSELQPSRAIYEALKEYPMAAID